MGPGLIPVTVAPQANWEAYGCEISPAAVRYARETLGLTNVICARLDEVDLPPSSFDLVTMWDVIDHIPRQQYDEMDRNMSRVLKEQPAAQAKTA